MKLKPIKITEKQKGLLDKLKVHTRQPYHEVLEPILEPLTIPTFTERERKKLLDKLEYLRSVIKKRMEKAR